MEAARRALHASVLPHATHRAGAPQAAPALHGREARPRPHLGDAHGLRACGQTKVTMDVVLGEKHMRLHDVDEPHGRPDDQRQSRARTTRWRCIAAACRSAASISASVAAISPSAWCPTSRKGFPDDLRGPEQSGARHPLRRGGGAERADDPEIQRAEIQRSRRDGEVARSRHRTGAPGAGRAEADPGDRRRRQHPHHPVRREPARGAVGDGRHRQRRGRAHP